MTSVRLTYNQEKQLDELARQKNVSRSAIIKEALTQYINSQEQLIQPYAVGEPLFGAYGSGQADRSETYKARLKSKIKSKHTTSL